MLLFYEGYIILVSHPNTNPAQQGLTSVNFGITKLSDAQRARLKGLCHLRRMRVARRPFEKVGPTFSNSVEDSVSLFQSLSIASISSREATFAFKDQSLVIK